MARNRIGTKNFIFLCLYFMPILSLCPPPRTNLTKQFIHQHHFCREDTLDFSNCSLESIEEGAFIGCNKVRIVYLGSNKLARISSAIFMGLTNVAGIYLNNNQLRYIKEGNLNIIGGQSIRLLDLSENELVDINEKSFSHLPYLDTLDLSFNKRLQLSDNLFRHLSKISQLKLNNCGIRQIKNNTLCDLENLETLELKNNGIKSIFDHAFQYSLKLARLDLSNNSLNEIKCAMFSGKNQSLVSESLDLSRNIIFHIADGTFDDLRSLRSLRLDHNPLHQIDSNVFSGLVGISTLYLRNCSITQMAVGSLEGLGTLKQLNLDDNNITWLSDAFQSFVCQQLRQRRMKLFMYGNPLQCNCDLNILQFCLASAEHWNFYVPRCLHAELPCNSPTVPAIQQLISAEQNTAILQCESTGDPVSSLTWISTNSSDIEYPPPNNHSILKNTARLVINLDSQTSLGKYICNASNRAGWSATTYWLTPLTNTTIPPATTTSASTTSLKSGLDFGTVIGAIIGCIAFIVVCVVGGYRLHKSGKIQLPTLRSSKLFRLLTPVDDRKLINQDL